MPHYAPEKREAMAHEVMEDFFKRRYDGHSRAVMDSLPLRDIVEAADYGDTLSCRDAADAAIMYRFPSDKKIVLFQEVSRHPPVYAVTVFIYERGRMKAVERHELAGDKKLKVMAQAAKKVYSIEEAIRGEGSSH